MNELDLAYAAGIVDGEGCIGINYRSPGKHCKKETMSPVFYLAMADKSLIYWFYESFGVGWVVMKKKEHSYYKQQYRWMVQGKDVFIVLNLLLPYLRGKKPQALELLKWPTMHQGKHISDEEMATRKTIRQNLKLLKRIV